MTRVQSTSSLPSTAWSLQDAKSRFSELDDWLEHGLRPMHEQRVLPVSEDIVPRWRRLVEEGRKVGYAFSRPDLIIAVAALHHGKILVTRDGATTAGPAFSCLILGPTARRRLPRQGAGRG